MKHCTQCGAPMPEDARFCPRCGAASAVASGGDPLLGKVIADRYLLVEKVGQGGSGVIYRAEHTTLSKRVAVKILHTQLSTDDTALERFRREATTVAELDNEHILQVLDFGRTEDRRLFFAMEFLEGETLTKVIERTRQLPVIRAVDIAIQIAEALMEAHGLGYVHRDLRPRNVFLINKRGRADFVKLLDFGLAKLVLPNMEAKQTAMGMTFGDPRYMSPEQARGETLDRRSDIYSLGAILFEMLTGTPPFSGAGTFEILQQHLDASPPRVRDRRPDCPEWLDALVQRALAKKPEGRFVTVLKMIECLRAQAAPGPADAAEKAAHVKLSSEPKAADGAAPGRQTRQMGSPAQAAAQKPAAPASAPAALVPPMAAPAPVVADAATASAGPRATLTMHVPKPAEAKAAPEVKPGAKAEARPEAKIDPKPEPVKPVPRGVAAASAAGSVEVTPKSTAAPLELANVPSVVIESSSQERTIPERPTVQAPAPQTPQAAHAESLKPRKSEPTGEHWFSSDSQPIPLVAGVDDEYEDQPKKSRGTQIIVGVTLGLSALITIVVLSMPKPQQKPLHGEQSTEASKPAKAKPAPAPSPSPAAVAAAQPTPPPAAVAPPAPAHAEAAKPEPPPPAAPEAQPEVKAEAKSPPKVVAPAAPKVAAAPAPKPVAPAPKPVAPAPKPVAPASKVALAPAPKPAAPAPKPADKPTRVASADKPAADKRGKREQPPEGFKDPWAGEPGKPAAGGSAQAEFFVKLGRQKLGSSDLVAAAANFNKAREYDARSAEAVAGLGEVAFEQGDYNGAAVHLKQALKLAPNRARYLVLLGQTYYKLGKPREAVTEYKKALHLDPSNQEAQHSLEVAERKLAQQGG
jgi:serine/threonine-protein kinase